MSPVAHIRLLPEPIEVDESLEDVGSITPELALVDPELAQAARALLPDRPAFEVSPPAVPMPVLASTMTVAAAVEPPPGESDSAIGATPTTEGGAFVLRHFAAGILVGLLVAGSIVEAYVLLEPFRSGPTSGPVATTPAIAEPTPTASPTVGAPATRQPRPAAPIPGAVATTSPPRPATILAWPASPGASAYRVILLGGGRRIFERTTRSTRLPLPVRWRYEGRQRRLVPGTYRWIVKPLHRVGSTWRPGAPIVDAAYIVPRTPS